MDLSVGQARWPFTLEKRYVDVLAPDGTVLLVYLGWVSLGGLRLRRVTADLFQPGAVARRGSAATGRARGGEGWADHGAARIDGENLSFETTGLSARLRDQRLLVEGRVADLEGLGLGVLRPVVRRLARDPHQVKWACTAELLGTPGVAIQELVRWR